MGHPSRLCLIQSGDDGFALLDKPRDELSRRLAARHAHALARPQRKILGLTHLCGGGAQRARQCILERVRQDGGGALAAFHFVHETIHYAARRTAGKRASDARLVLGTQETVRERLTAMQREFEADEVMVITITGDYDARLRSYELLAGAFELS